MIYITGDTHGIIDWHKINTSNFSEQKSLSKDDYLIILGDFGGVWDGAGQDRYIINNYNRRSFTTLFIDGNHENFDLLDSFPVEEWNGGKIHRISGSVIHLMRGQVFTIEDIKFFTMGGAESTDKQYRKEGVSWWEREMPSDKEYEEALRNLEKHNFDVDIVLTHCAPEGYICKKMTAITDRSGNRLTRFLDELIMNRNLRYQYWFFGHYHDDLDQGGFSLVYKNIWEIYKDQEAMLKRRIINV